MAHHSSAFRPQKPRQARRDGWAHCRPLSRNTKCPLLCFRRQLSFVMSLSVLSQRLEQASVKDHIDRRRRSSGREVSDPVRVDREDVAVDNAEIGHLAGSIDPLTCSLWSSQAALTVYVRMASGTVMHCSGPLDLPVAFDSLKTAPCIPGLQSG